MNTTPAPVQVLADEARSLAERILVAVGTPEADAHRVVDSLVYADRRGVGTHGLMRLKFYVDRVTAGGIDPVAPVEVVRDAPATALIDGANGFGAVVTTRATEVAIDKAREVGAAAVVARSMNHFGAAAYYAAMASAHGMVGIVMANVTASMAPTGGTAAVVGNNPIAFAFPSADSAPVVFDAATSRSSWGALLRAVQRGEPLPEDAFLGPDGLPSGDPDVVLQGGSLQPIEGHKGYGLALCIALLTGVLGGGAFDADIAHPYRDLSGAGDNSALVLVLDVGRFTTLPDFSGRVLALSRDIRSTPASAGAPSVMMPGDREALAAAQAGESLWLEQQTLAEIDEIASGLGLDARIGVLG